MRVFYVRCSTMEQNEARQLKMAEEQNAEKVFVDKASGKNTDRAAFKEMMAFVRADDTVVVESISRIARNTRDLLSIVSELTEKGVEFVSIKESIDTTTRWLNWSGRTFWSGSARALKSPKARANIKAASPLIMTRRK